MEEDAVRGQDSSPIVQPNKAQRSDEMRAFLNLIRKEGVTKYLEVGVQRGLTFLSVASALEPDATMIGVDLPGAAWGVKEGNGKELIEAARAKIHQTYGHYTEMIWGNSHDADVLGQVYKHGPFDLVFIDADHSYDAVRQDFMDYGTLSSMVALHDIDIENKPGIDEARLARYGTHILWKELKEQYRHEEILGKQRGMGIGVLWRE